jgi:Spy/CpxP family protein refolding chaperone
MTMKRIFLITILFLSVFSLAQAQRDTGQRPSRGGGGNGQGRMDPAERVERQTQRLTEALSLNADQIAKVKAIYTKNAENQRKAVEEARASGQQPDREKMREQMRASMTKQDNEIKALLTAEQKVKFEEFIKEREERMKNWQGRQGGPGGAGQN